MTESTVQPSIPENAFCLGCGYSLRALPAHRCPECGRSFDPEDPWTMNTGRPYGRVAGFFLSTVGRPTYFAAGIATFLVFWWTAYLPWSMLAMLLGIYLWALIYLFRIARFIARRIVARMYRQPLRRERRIVLLVLITVTGLMIWTRFPLRAMLWMSRPAMDRLAKHFYEESPLIAPPPAPSFVGLYPVHHVDVTTKRVAVNIDREQMLVYSGSDSPPTIDYDEWFIPLGGNWYLPMHPESRILAHPIVYIKYWHWLLNHQ